VGGLTDGVVEGAGPDAQFVLGLPHIYPPIAALLTRAIAMGTPMSATIQSLFDANADDIVTAEELIANDTMASLTAADLDLDGDDVTDHISVGVQFEAVRCQLVP